MPLQIRRGTNAERQAMIQPLASGELLYVTDDQRLYIGNGTTVGGVQITGYTDGDAKDAAAAIFTGGTHSGITFTYDTIGNTISASVNLSAYEGLVDADVRGSVFADDSTLLVDGVSGRIVGPVFANVTGDVTGNLTGNVSGNVTGDITGVVTGNAGSSLIGNVTGALFGNSIGYHTGDVQGSVFADDSTMLIDSTNAVVRGEHRPSDIIIEGPQQGILINTEGTIDDDYNLFSIKAHSAGVTGPGISYSRSRGTTLSPTTSVAGDEIVNWLFAGTDTSNAPQPSAYITVSVSGTVGSGIVPGTIDLQTADNTGTLVSGLSIDHNQLLTVASNTVTAGVGSGQANTGSVAVYLKIKIGSTEYAIPGYAINP